VVDKVGSQSAPGERLVNFGVGLHWPVFLKPRQGAEQKDGNYENADFMMVLKNSLKNSSNTYYVL